MLDRGACCAGLQVNLIVPDPPFTPSCFHIPSCCTGVSIVPCSLPSFSLSAVTCQEPLIACMLLASARKPSYAANGNSAAADATGRGIEGGEAGGRGGGVACKKRRVAAARTGDSDSGSGSGGEEEEEDDVFGLCSEEMCTIAACLCVQVRGFSSWGLSYPQSETRPHCTSPHGGRFQHSVSPIHG